VSVTFGTMAALLRELSIVKGQKPRKVLLKTLQHWDRNTSLSYHRVLTTLGRYIEQRGDVMGPSNTISNDERQSQSNINKWNKTTIKRKGGWTSPHAKHGPRIKLCIFCPRRSVASAKLHRKVPASKNNILDFKPLRQNQNPLNWKKKTPTPWLRNRN